MSTFQSTCASAIRYNFSIHWHIHRLPTLAITKPCAFAASNSLTGKEQTLPTNYLNPFESTATMFLKQLDSYPSRLLNILYPTTFSKLSSHICFHEFATPTACLLPSASPPRSQLRVRSCLFRGLRPRPVPWQTWPGPTDSAEWDKSSAPLENIRSWPAPKKQGHTQLWGVVASRCWNLLYSIQL